MENHITLINNNDYGAPELQKNYNRNLREAMVIAILLHVAAIAAYLLISYINQANAEEKKFKPISKPIIVDVETPPSINDELPKIKPEEIVKQQKDISALEPKPVPKQLSDNVLMKTQDELNKTRNNVSDKGDSITYIAGNNNIKIDDNKIVTKIDKDKTKLPVTQIWEDYRVEVVPVCTNLQQVRSSILYPPLAVDAGIEGRVTVRVLVGEAGNVIKIGALSGNEIFFDEVTEKSKNLEFTPGLQNNVAVKVWISVPFNFKLKN
jgi:TonB family protein